MAFPVTADFTAANNASIAAVLSDWSLVTGTATIGITSNSFYSSGAGESAAYWDTDTPVDNQYAQCVLAALGGGGNAPHVGPAIRCGTGAENYYGVYAGADCQFFEVVAGTWAQFGSNLTVPAVNSVLRIEVVGSLIRVLDDGAQIGSTTDTSLASGMVGICGYSGASDTGSRGDTWEGGELPGPWLVAAGTAAYTATSSATVTPGLPTDWAADDILVLWYHISSNDDLADPSGWTRITPSAAAEDNTSAQRVEVFVRRAVGGDSAPVLAGPANTNVRGARIVAIRGCPTSGNAEDHIAASSRSNNAASATVTFATITPVDLNTCLVALEAYEDDPTARTTPSGWNAPVISTSSLGNDMALVYATRSWADGSATGSITWTVSGGTFANSVNVGILLAFTETADAVVDMTELLGRPFGLRGVRQMSQLLAQ